MRRSIHEAVCFILCNTYIQVYNIRIRILCISAVPDVNLDDQPSPEPLYDNPRLIYTPDLSFSTTVLHWTINAFDSSDVGHLD